jgi:Family of unknown function (DUF5343)
VAQANETKTGYPRIPTRNWWELRRRFRQSPPRQVDPSYLGTVLGVSDKAARNLLPYLRTTGLIDEAGQPTQRALEWRDDEHYAEVCEDIRQDVYPRALVDALPPPNPDKGQISRWFSRETRTGQSNASQMAAFYALLCKADLDEGEQSTDRQPRAERDGRTRAAAQRQATRRRESRATENAESSPTPTILKPEGPAVHIDINIHIDSSSSPEQIDQILASMARRLYGREV